MNREQAKNIWELIKAYGEGKIIQEKHVGSKTDVWTDMHEMEELDLNDSYWEYRIKPEEPTFRCWKCGRELPLSERTGFAYMSNPPKYTCKECEGLKKEKYYRPFKNCSELINTCGTKLIWVKSKKYGTENLITAFDNDNESIGGSCVFLQDIWLDMQELFNGFVFLDGSECGVEE